MATANESRFFASFQETRDKINALSSVLNVLSPPSETSRQLARQRLGDLKMDAAAYLAGNKAKAVITKLIQAGEVWDTNVKNNAAMNSIVTRVNRYLDEAQVIMGLPEGQIPVPTGDEASKAAQLVVNAAAKVKTPDEKAGKSSLSGGMIAAVGAGVLGLLWFMKRK